MDKRTANLLWSAVAAGLLLLWVFSLFGCADRMPVRIALPTAATVQARIGAPAAAAKASNARAATLAAKAEKSGLAADSADAHALTLATAETDQHLAEVLAGKDALTAQLGQTQLQIDALEKDDAAQRSLAQTRAAALSKATRARNLWLILFMLSLVADAAFGHLIERYLRGAAEAVWAVLGSAYHLAAGVLKAVFPLYTFWLPA